MDLRGPKGANGESRVVGASGLSESQVIALVQEHAVDDFNGPPEFLADQTSDGSVLAFIFTGGNVQKVWVELQADSVDDTSTGRVRTDGVDPTSTTGILIHAGQTQPITDTTSEVRVLADSGKTVTVYGYRR